MLERWIGESLVGKQQIEFRMGNRVHVNRFPVNQWTGLRRLGCLLVLMGWVGGSGSGVCGPGRELLRDPRFERGFHLLSPRPGRRAVERVVRWEESRGEPCWDLAQWSSRYSLAAGPVRIGEGGARELSDPAKKVVVGPPEGPSGDILLEVDSREEYARPRRQGEPWPHLLIQQAISDCPPLSEIGAVRLRLDARLRVNEVFRGEGYSRDLHCAQCPLVLIIQNRNADSPGFGDFLWFQVPLFDDRWPSPPPHVAQDTADPSAKLIYNPGLRAYTDQQVTTRSWMTLDLDLSPHIRAGLRTAWQEGYLKGSQDPGDYRITSFILGWEVPGINHAAIQFRNLSLEVVPPGDSPDFRTAH